MKPNAIIFLSALMLTIFLFFAFENCDKTKFESESNPLRVEWVLFPGFYPMAIAQELDLFEKHHVKVEPIFYEIVGSIISDFASKQLDGMMAPPGDFLILSEQAPIKIVLVLDNSAGADQIVATPNINSIADLRGKKLAYTQGSFSELFVRKMLEKNDLKITDVNTVIMASDLIPESLPGLIDAEHTWEPFSSRAVAAGNHLIFSSADTPGLISDVLGIHASVVEERPEDIRAFVAAWFEAVEFWKIIQRAQQK